MKNRISLLMKTFSALCSFVTQPPTCPESHGRMVSMDFSGDSSFLVFSVMRWIVVRMFRFIDVVELENRWYFNRIHLAWSLHMCVRLGSLQMYYFAWSFDMSRKTFRLLFRSSEVQSVPMKFHWNHWVQDNEIIIISSQFN